jgi:hypothetical protein
MISDLLLHEKTAPLETVWQTVKEHLEKKKSQIAEEILFYPPPIPACDAQFNFLLAERARVAQALVQLEGLASGALFLREDWLTFVSSLPELDEDIVEMLDSALAE